MTTPWEQSINDSLYTIRCELTEYIRSDTFKHEWYTWEFVRSDIKWLLFCKAFVYNNQSTKVIADVMYNALISHMKLIRQLHMEHIPFEFIVESVLDSTMGTPRRNLVADYQHLWSSATVIQTNWRRLKRCSGGT